MLAFLTIGGLAAAGLVGYELPAKTDEAFGRLLPGWRSARHAEEITRWRPCTGWHLGDRMLHEGEEAVHFWRFVLGSPPESAGRVRPPRMGDHRVQQLRT